MNVIMRLRGEGVRAMTLNFSMNFEPSFLVGLELVSTRSYTMSLQMVHEYLPLSSGMTISYFCHDAKRGGEGVQDLMS